MTEVMLEPVPALSKAILALPFGLIAVLAWSDWVLLPALLLGVLIVFAFRQNPHTNRYAAYSSIYAAVLVFAVPPWIRLWFLERLPMFFIALFLTHLIGLAFDGARDGSFWAWLAPLIVFAMQPSALGLITVLGFGMLGAFENRQNRLGIWSQSRAGLMLLASLSLLAMLITLSLPRPGPLLEGQTTNRPILAEQPPGSQTGEASAQTQVKAKANRLPPTPVNVLEVFNRSFVVINLALLTFLVCLTVLVLRRRSGARGETSRWEDALPLVAATILGLMVLLYGASAPGGGLGAQGGPTNRNPSSLQGSQTDTVAADSSVPELASRPAEDPWPTVILALLTVASVAWLMLRHSGRFIRPDLQPSEPKEILEPEAASNRVREAYRAFLALCTRAGLTRLETETPLEFAVRVGQHEQLALRPASDLTGLYEPVRYGGLSEGSGAQAAEQALVALRKILQPQDAGSISTGQISTSQISTGPNTDKG
jgi:hypothetical protein